MKRKTIYIFDTSAFIKGMDVSVLDDYECYTTEGVLAEIKDNFSKHKLDMAILTGNLRIRAPRSQDVSKVKNIAQISGDLQFLSATDIELIALALTVRDTISEQDTLPPSDVPVEVVTDDYSIQNILSQIPIPVHSYLQKGIAHYIQWQIYCPLCNTIYDSSAILRCPKCEVRLKRRPMDRE